jgi:serine/threonine protein kinase
MRDHEYDVLRRLEPSYNVPSVVERVELAQGPTIIFRPAANKVLSLKDGKRCGKTDFVKLLQVLQNAHKLNICHRDVKPDNIFKEDSGNVILSDWSSAATTGKSVVWAGTEWFYKMPTSNQHQPSPEDDLRALVRTVFLMYTMTFPRNWSLKQIENVFASSPLWRTALELAENCNYLILNSYSNYYGLRNFFNNL